MSDAPAPTARASAEALVPDLLAFMAQAQPPAEATASDYFLEAEVLPDCPLIGKTIEEAGLRNLGHLFLTEIVRGEHLIAPVEPDRFVNAGDVLVFTGDVTRLDLLAQFPGLRAHAHHDDLPLDNLVEVVVAAGSSLARRTIREVDFRSHFDAAVVAVRRGAERLGGSIGQTRLEVGDALVLVTGQDFDKRNNLARNFVVVSRREVQKFVDPRKGWLFVPSNQLPWFVRSHYLNTQATPESVAKVAGHDRYAAACAGCHGATGEGKVAWISRRDCGAAAAGADPRHGADQGHAVDRHAYPAGPYRRTGAPGR